jgi:AcrR family transcriptional regulator
VLTQDEAAGGVRDLVYTSRVPASEIAKRRAAARSNGGAKYEARRAHIIRAAAKVFREKGLRGVTVDDVARVAGTDRASIYYYASSKQELFKEVVRDACLANTVLAEETRDGEGTPTDKMRRIVTGLMAAYADNPHLLVFIQEDASKLDRRGFGRELVALYRRYEDAVIAVIQGGIDDGSFRDDIPPRVAAYGIIGMVNWSHRWFNSQSQYGADEVGANFADLALQGIARLA